MSFITGPFLFQGLVSGICLGGTYILIGLGLTLILSVMNILQFAHGEVYMIGAFIVYYLTVTNGVNILAAIPISMVTTAILGLFLERILLRPLGGRFVAYICVTTGLSLILQTAVVLLFGLDVKNLPNIWPGAFHVFGAVVPRDRFIAVVISLVLTLLLYLFLKKTKYGMAITASPQSREGAVLQGINPIVMSAIVMAIGSGLAAVGGALGGGIFGLDPYMGGTAMFKGIIIIVIGGMGSVLGTVVGGLIVGISDSLISLIFGANAALIVPLIIVIIILLIRPKGLFGHD